ncbi:MAG: hypothetical protein FWE91_00445 [Defluviitaleaceae bacterium]|nr:hypothetical protein [Defluviitaleaceae bacterium]MCL2836250.1 hypothetical protein [Defluviitaleaceae bacterium]
MEIIGIIQLLIPVVTFAMGYFLTDIGYKRDRKLSIVREKFEKLYHTFYVLLHEFGTDTEEGFAFDTENSAVLKPIIDHLTTNAYLASSEGQKLIWKTRNIYISYMSRGEDIIDKEKDQLFEKSLTALFDHLILEYVKAAKALGYDLDIEAGAGETEG